MSTVTYEEALSYWKYPKHLPDYESYKEGFKSGWYDRYLGLSLTTSKTSTYGRYAMGYVDGQVAWDCYSSPLKEEGGVICLTNILV